MSRFDRPAGVRAAFLAHGRRFALLSVAVCIALGSGLSARADFTVSSGTDNAAKTLGPSAGQTGTIAAGATLSVGGGTVAVTITGNNAALTNLGMLLQTGTGRAIRNNTSPGVTGLLITNGSATNSTALMQAADADVIQMNTTPASVTLNNYGTMRSLNASAGGAQAVDFNAILSGSNAVNNFATGLLEADKADSVRPGVNGTVSNAGIIRSIEADPATTADGIDLQNNSGVQISNAVTGLIEGARHGITGAQVNATTAFTTTITNDLGGIIKGDNGSGINIDGFNALQTATIVNNGTITGNGVARDGDGIDVDGLVNLTNTGLIRSINAFSSGGLGQSEGITVGGGTIVNSGTIEGLVAPGNTNATGRGISLLGNDITTGPLAGTREPIYGNATVTNQAGGLIRGDSDSGIAVDGPASGFTVVINNNALATIMGGGVTNAAIRTGADNDTINNAGTIDGSSSGKAIDMGAGNNTLLVTGGAASILGDVNGGTGGANTMTMDLGAGNAFTYSGAISNFGTVEVKSGTATLSGVSTYTGGTVISGGALVLDGAQRVSSASALTLSGGTLKMTNAGGPNGQTFASLALTGDSTIDLALSSLSFNTVGAIVAGHALTVTNWSDTTSPLFAFRFFGDVSASADFLRLIGETTIDGLAASFAFDGVYTDVRAVPLPASGVLLLAGLGLFGALAKRRNRSGVMMMRLA